MIFAVLQWVGIGVLLAPVAMAAGQMWSRFWTLVALGAVLVGAPAVFAGSAQEKAWSLALAVPVLPFPGLVLAVCTVGFVASMGSLWTRSLGPAVAIRKKAVLGWAAASVACGLWWRATGESAEILQGRLGFGPREVAWTVAAYLAGLGVSVWASRAPRRRTWVREISLHLSLVLGSLVFCLPLYWLVLTSLRDNTLNTAADSLVFAPQVAVIHPFRDPDEPLVRTRFNGEPVLAKLVRPVGSSYEMEVERPFRLRGFLFEEDLSNTREVDREGEVVRLPDGREGYISKPLEKGMVRVVLLHPAPQAGQQVVVARDETEQVYRFGFRWANFGETLEWLPAETQNGLTYLLNSVWLSVLNVIGTLVSCSMAGFAFSRMRFPGKNGLFWLLLASMMLPVAVTIVPKFLLWRSLGAVDSLVPLWLPSFFASAFYVFLLRQFYKTLPSELEDAARIDGCGYWRICWKVMTPQVKPALIVIGLWTFFGAWNDFMGPLTYLSTPEKMPVAYAVQLFRSDRGGEIGLMMAFAAMATLPLLIIFLFAQRKLVEGVQLSGLGGR